MHLDCERHVVEPVPSLFAAIPAAPRLHKYPVAISAECSPLQLHLASNPEANSVDRHISEAFGLGETVTVRGITLEKFLEENKLRGKVALLKVDIEGAEKMLFASTSDATLQEIPQISIEFHDFVEGSTDLPFVLDTISRMKKLGFFFLPYSYLMPYAKHADVLFLQPTMCGLSFYERTHLVLARFLLEVQGWKARLKGD